MTTVTDRRKVLSVREKVKLIQEESGKKKDDLCREFGLENYTIQTIWKTEPKLLVRLIRTHRE
jgi:hypothetical protein